MTEVPNPFQEDFDRWVKEQKPLNDLFEVTFHQNLKLLREGEVTPAQFYQALTAESHKTSIFLRCLSGPFKGDMKLALDRTEEGTLELRGNDGLFGVVTLNENGKLAIEQLSRLDDPMADVTNIVEPKVSSYRIDNNTMAIVNEAAILEDVF